VCSARLGRVLYLSWEHSGCKHFHFPSFDTSKRANVTKWLLWSCRVSHTDDRKSRRHLRMYLLVVNSLFSCIDCIAFLLRCIWLEARRNISNRRLARGYTGSVASELPRPMKGVGLPQNQTDCTHHRQTRTMRTSFASRTALRNVDCALSGMLFELCSNAVKGPPSLGCTRCRMQSARKTRRTWCIGNIAVMYHLGSHTFGRSQKLRLGRVADGFSLVLVAL